MEKFKPVTSKVIPLPMNDVDTDQIIPAQFLTSVSKEGYGENLFRRMKDKDESFPMNKPEYKNAKVLVAGYNFGCGSSREHAVWAITGAGIKVVVAESFADIFYNNSAKNGLLLVQLSRPQVEELLKDAKADPNYKVRVDLENQVVVASNGKKCRFEYDAFRKHCLLNGLDDIDYILSYSDELDQYREASNKPWMKSLKDNTAEPVAEPAQVAVPA